jgi:hypothetical protein
MITLSTIAPYIAAVLTVMIFSYLIGDNPLYRIALHLFIGAAAGFVLVVSIESVLLPWIQLTLIPGIDNPNFIVGMIPLLIGVLLLFKTSPRLSRFGNFGLAFVLGVGAAVSLYGAVAGTLIPVAGSVARGMGFRDQPERLAEGIITLVGTISVLVYFTYLGRRRPSGEIVQPLVIRSVGLVGRGFVVITLGATYGLVIISALTILTGVLVNRLLFLIR